ncbi:unnamed protein product [Owenia fusiformis]|uniref:Uncharacterized protein n=1 Tax=Owenia fusiformis TaxID=6347 RepID=A0A8J1THN4_OWEFU|nr:unnamed protein product [Owenia fusiformis]
MATSEELLKQSVLNTESDTADDNAAIEMTDENDRIKREVTGDIKASVDDDTSKEKKGQANTEENKDITNKDDINQDNTDDTETNENRNLIEDEKLGTDLKEPVSSSNVRNNDFDSNDTINDANTIDATNNANVGSMKDDNRPISASNTEERELGIYVDNTVAEDLNTDDEGIDIRNDTTFEGSGSGSNKHKDNENIKAKDDCTEKDDSNNVGFNAKENDLNKDDQPLNHVNMKTDNCEQCEECKKEKQAKSLGQLDQHDSNTKPLCAEEFDPADHVRNTLDPDDIQSNHNPVHISLTDIEHMAGLRGKTNTPASYYTEWTELKGSRPGSRLAPVSKDAMYKEAMSLISARCTSTQQGQGANRDTPLISLKEPPFGYRIPQYFYVQQKTPIPLKPLKAWRGYHGNVYFEPILVQPANIDEPTHIDKSKTEPQYSDSLAKILSRGKKGRPTRPRTTKSEPADSTPLVMNSRSKSAISAPTRTYVYGHSRPGTRQMVVLDKKSVLNRENVEIQEDLRCVLGQEATGTLALEPKHGRSSNPQQARLNRTKIYKGSMVSRTAKGNLNRPLLAVSGDRYNVPMSSPPILRAQTQYSQSNLRIGMSTPDMSTPTRTFSVENRLPPLEELRVNLRNMNYSPSSEELHYIMSTLEKNKHIKNNTTSYIRFENAKPDVYEAHLAKYQGNMTGHKKNGRA